MDEVEDILKINCAPITWPIGMGKRLKGVYHFINDTVLLYESGKNYETQQAEIIQGLDNPALDAALGADAEDFREEIELVKGASHAFDKTAYLRGELTPVFFGSAINNFGVEPLLDAFAEHAPPPQPRETETRIVEPNEEEFTGFVFKIQANMDPKHRDRIAFMRICSGTFSQGMKLKQIRTGKDIKIPNALTFLAEQREHLENAYTGDIIGIHNHGTISIGDTFSTGEALKFTGIPSFAPELFRRAQLKDPLKLKALHKGLAQLSEEGATQFFKPMMSNDLILGAIGVLQFEVVAYRLLREYNVEALFENINVATARWISADNEKELTAFKNKAIQNLALDAHGYLVYIAPTYVNLQLTQERFPEIQFHKTTEGLNN